MPEPFVTGYRQAYAAYMCAMEGHQVIVNATSTAPQPFPGGVCTRCGQHLKPESVPSLGRAQDAE